MNISKLNEEVFSIKKEIEDAKSDLKIFKSEQEKLGKLKGYLQEAIKILTVVLGTTQEEIITFIEDITTSALQHVYGEEYSFRIEFQMKRNQPEVYMTPYKGEMIYDPKLSCGGGVVDVCSFALRVACHAILNPAPDNVLVFDEPFSAVHGSNENERLGQMVSELSKTYGLQIIIISGESILTNYADKAFSVDIEKGESIVLEL